MRRSMNPRRWLQEHSLKLLAIRDTPEAIAGGVAIGMFFGFTPLLGIKTLSAIFVAWLTRSNIIAAVVAGALHDLVLPFMPAIYLFEYGVGYWLLSTPHHWPHRTAIHWGNSWREWTSFFFGMGKVCLLGSVVCATPIAMISYGVTKALIARHQRKKQALHHPGPQSTETPPPPGV
jgi:uncharacterized protein (DUF2062 family)